MALVAEHCDPSTLIPEVVAVGRLSKGRGVPEAEFAILVADRWQHHGLGTELLDRLVRIGRAEGLERIWAEMLAANSGMRRASERVGFRIRPIEGDQSVVLAELDPRN